MGTGIRAWWSVTVGLLLASAGCSEASKAPRDVGAVPTDSALALGDVVFTEAPAPGDLPPAVDLTASEVGPDASPLDATPPAPDSAPDAAPDDTAILADSAAAPDLPTDPGLASDAPAADPGEPDAPSPTDVVTGPDVPLPASLVGCADGTREGFLDIASLTLLAACGGAWSVPGIHHPTPSCARAAGNDGTNADGVGCNVEDLCAEGWHVCLGKTDVLLRNDLGCQGILDGAHSPAFFLARTSSTGAFDCAPDTIGEPTSENDLFGCGDLGCVATTATCAPLTQASHDLCKTLRNKPTADCTCQWNAAGTGVTCAPTSGGCGWCKPLDYWNVLLGIAHPDAWDCGTDGENEALNVVKSYPDQQGGVLCCKDF